MPARPTTWVDTILSRSIPAGSQQTQSLILEMSAGDKRQSTAIRIIIDMWMSSESVAGAWGVQRLTCAIGVASQEAFLAGTLPDPNIAIERPARGWMWRGSPMVAQNGAGSPVLYHVMADLRAARKIENGELYMIFNADTINGTSFTTRLDGLIRVLMKL